MRDIFLRTALWEAHKHLCAYCGQLVPFAEMQADHVIPATLKSDAAEGARVLNGLGLPETADLDDIWNRLPIHGRCNRVKSDDPLSDNSTRFFLEIAKKIEPKVIRETERLRDRAHTDRMKAAIAIAVASGQLSVDEVVRAAVVAGSEPKLIARLQMDNSSSTLIRAVADGMPVSELLSLPILPREHGLDELTMIKDKERVTVMNCADWAERRRAGFFAATTYDLKEEVFFQNAYATLHALKIAVPSVASFIESMRLGTEAAAIMPASFLPYLSPDEDATVKDWVARGVSLLDLSKNADVVLGESLDTLTITWNGMTAYVSEILRADLDGDGVEDLLYSYYSRVHKGTFGAGHVGVLTRRSDSAMLEEIVVPAMTP